jgi:hypothetical protein
MEGYLLERNVNQFALQYNNIGIIYIDNIFLVSAARLLPVLAVQISFLSLLFFFFFSF